MIKPYLVTFEPIDTFFFGGSESFSEGFHVHSNLFPQPTTVLGCLRFNILKNNDLLEMNSQKGREFPKPDKNGEVNRLTGESDANGLDASDSLGIIRRISPVFLVKFSDSDEKVEDFLLQTPADFCFNSKDLEMKYIEYKKQNKGKSFVRNKPVNHVLNSDRDIKAKCCEQWGNAKFWRKYLEHENFDYNSIKDEEIILKADIFVEHQQPGIGRENPEIEGKRIRGKTTKEGQFYIKHEYSFKKGFAFGVIVHLDDDSDNLADADVFLGGERSLFRMRKLKIENDIKDKCDEHHLVSTFCDTTNNGDLFNGSSAGDKLVLLSPMISGSKITGLEHAYIPYMQSTRMLSGQNSGKGVYKTDSYKLIPAGSVLYPDSEFKFSNNSFRFASKIGYNWAIKANRKV